MTFPDGSRVGTLVVSPVTADKLPMAPPAGGAQFGVPAWTIQPAGTRFDPPIEVTLPNASSQPPGDNLPIVQWDHDLGQYTAMGRATVSEDGSVLVTDSGSGLTKAGWGGLCRYDPDKCAKEAPKCKDCQKSVTKPGADCPTCEFNYDPNFKEINSIGAAGAVDLTNSRLGQLLRSKLFRVADKTLFKLIPGGSAALAIAESLVGVQLNAKGEGKTVKECCERTKSVAEKSEYSGILEAEWILKETPIIATKDVPLGCCSVEKVGLIFNAKLTGSGAIKVSHEVCDEDKWVGSGEVGLNLSGNLFVGIQIIDKVGILRTRGDNILVLGAEGGVQGGGKLVGDPDKMCFVGEARLTAKGNLQLLNGKVDFLTYDAPIFSTGEKLCSQWKEIGGYLGLK